MSPLLLELILENPVSFKLDSKAVSLFPLAKREPFGFRTRMTSERSSKECGTVSGSVMLERTTSKDDLV